MIYTDSPMRTYRAGDTVEEMCRVCKIDRLHTVIATDASGRPVRVQCDYCGSQHNSHMGRSTSASAEVRRPGASADRQAESRWQTAPRLGRQSSSNAPPFLLASDLERKAPAASGDASQTDDPADVAMEPVTASLGRADEAPMSGEDGMVDVAMLEDLLRRVVREESGFTAVEPADKWRGGMLVLKPAKPGMQEKLWPIDTFFHKIVMIRNRLRTLEQQVNALDLPEDEKLRLQAYITGCYGTLTSFNVLFADEDDKFQGSESRPGL